MDARSAAGSESGDDGVGRAAGPRLGVGQRLPAQRGGGIVALDDTLDDLDDAEEAQPTLVESVHRLLVRGVEHRRVGAAGAADAVGRGSAARPDGAG